MRELEEPEKVENKLQELLKDYQSKKKEFNKEEEDETQNASASTKNISNGKENTDAAYVTPVQVRVETNQMKEIKPFIVEERDLSQEKPSFKPKTHDVEEEDLGNMHVGAKRLRTEQDGGIKPYVPKPAV